MTNGGAIDTYAGVDLALWYFERPYTKSYLF